LILGGGIKIFFTPLLMVVVMGKGMIFERNSKPKEMQK
jgi:hypothetical protein